MRINCILLTKLKHVLETESNLCNLYNTGALTSFFLYFHKLIFLKANRSLNICIRILLIRTSFFNLLSLTLMTKLNIILGKLECNTSYNM